MDNCMVPVLVFAIIFVSLHLVWMFFQKRNAAR